MIGIVWACSACGDREISVDEPGAPCRSGHFGRWRRILGPKGASSRWTLTQRSVGAVTTRYWFSTEDGTTAHIIHFRGAPRSTVEFGNDLSKYAGATYAAELAAHVYRAASHAGDAVALVGRARLIAAGESVPFAHVDMLCEEIPSGRLYVGNEHGLASVASFFGISLDDSQ